jgi:uncharacterized protein
MKVLQQVLMPYNTGKALIVLKGQHLRVIGQSTVDLVCFDLHNLRHRFDQARTKVVQWKLFLTKGDLLISKDNEIMFTIVEDTFPQNADVPDGVGTHDLEKGMCSGSFYVKWADRIRERWKQLGRPPVFPDHGCWENLAQALEPWGIPAEDIPSPFNIFQTMVIDGKTGSMIHKGIHPKPGTYVEMRAEMDCLVGLSACPEGGLGKEASALVIDPAA